MINFDIRNNVEEFNRRLTAAGKKQVPFATKNAINATLLEARKSIIKRVQNKQKSRKAWWNNKQTGINRQFATKKRLTGSIGTGIYWAKTQEYGGTRRPGGKAFAVPTSNVPKGKRKAGGAQAILQQKTTFSGHGGIYRRVGGKKSRQVKLLFSYAPSVHISKPIIGLRKTAAKVAKRRFAKNHKKALIAALKTAR